MKKSRSYTVRDLPATERPRERLAAFGSHSLSLSELLAIILGRGTAGESVMVTAQNIISQFGSLEALQEASLEDLQKIRGLGFAKACQIKAALELSRRMGDTQTAIKKRKSLLSPEEVYMLLKPKITQYAKEHFLVLSFDTRNNLLGIDTISIGTLNASLVHPRETFESAIKRHAASIILAHNHPSGDPDPSDDDVKVTAKLVEAGRHLDISVLDHVILGKGSYYSFRNENMF